MKQNSTCPVQSSWPSAAVNVGLVMVAAATLLPFFAPGLEAMRWIYSVGALISLVGRLMTPVPAEMSVRQRRLARMLVWSSVFFCVAAFFMFYPSAGVTDWIAFTLAGAIIIIYATLMMRKLSA